MRQIVLIIHNVRSSHNVGSMLRTADGLGIEKVYITGYSPYPKQTDDERLPHIAAKVHAQISKTALGAEETLDWQRIEDINEVFDDLRASGYQIAALEQTANSTDLNTYSPASKFALVVGNEVYGIDKSTLSMVDANLQIPMFGKKESFNVASAAAMAMFYARFSGTVALDKTDQ